MYSREELINICKEAVVPYTKWGDRDSYCAQQEISSIYALLMSGCDYVIDKDTDERTIWITFKDITHEQRAKSFQYSLPIDSREDYFNAYGRDYEMFKGSGLDIDSGYLTGYMPTRKRLIACNGDDWY